jgi:nucleoside-diphosphate-sugar epimerase
MRLAITGSAGTIGSQLTEELSADHELRLIDRVPMPGRRSILADLAVHRARSYRKPWLKEQRPDWMRLFEGVDVVLHLAANPSPRAPWTRVIANNIQATWNVIEAATNHRVPRVVFASSNWAVKSLEQRMAPDCYQPGGPKIGSDAPSCPVNAYGLSKAFGELAGRMLVDSGGLTSFIAVRIGCYAREAPNDPILRARWIGSQDIRSLFRCCIESPITGFHIVYGVSAQPSAPYDLSHTSQLLGWKPQQTL